MDDLIKEAKFATKTEYNREVSRKQTEKKVFRLIGLRLFSLDSRVNWCEEFLRGLLKCVNIDQAFAPAVLISKCHVVS